MPHSVPDFHLLHAKQHPKLPPTPSLLTVDASVPNTSPLLHHQAVGKLKDAVHPLPRSQYAPPETHRFRAPVPREPNASRAAAEEELPDGCEEDDACAGMPTLYSSIEAKHSLTCRAERRTSRYDPSTTPRPPTSIPSPPISISQWFLPQRTRQDTY